MDLLIENLVSLVFLTALINLFLPKLKLFVISVTKIIVATALFYGAHYAILRFDANLGWFALSVLVIMDFISLLLVVDVTYNYYLYYRHYASHSFTLYPSDSRTPTFKFSLPRGYRHLSAMELAQEEQALLIRKKRLVGREAAYSYLDSKGEGPYYLSWSNFFSKFQFHSPIFFAGLGFVSIFLINSIANFFGYKFLGNFAYSLVKIFSTLGFNYLASLDYWMVFASMPFLALGILFFTTTASRFLTPQILAVNKNFNSRLVEIKFASLFTKGLMIAFLVLTFVSPINILILNIGHVTFDGLLGVFNSFASYISFAVIAFVIYVAYYLHKRAKSKDESFDKGAFKVILNLSYASAFIVLLTSITYETILEFFNSMRGELLLGENAGSILGNYFSYEVFRIFKVSFGRMLYFAIINFTLVSLVERSYHRLLTSKILVLFSDHHNHGEEEPLAVVHPEEVNLLAKNSLSSGEEEVQVPKHSG